MKQCVRNAHKKSINIFFIIIIVMIFIILIFIYSFKISHIHNIEIQEKQNVESIKNKYHETIDKSVKHDNNNYYTDKNTIFNPINEEKYDRDESENNVNIMNNNNTSNYNDDKENIKKKSADCIIEIPDIDLSKIVYTGMSREKHLDNYELVTATPDMKFSNGGNYIICGHASRLYGHSLNRLGEVHKDSLIQIWCNDKVVDYIVKDVYYENMNNTDKYCKQTTQKEITIISCAKYISKESYIVIKAIPK